MKLQVIVLGMLITTLSSCKWMFEKKPVNCVSWVVDTTDSLARVNATEVLALYKLSNDRIYEGYYFRSAFIGEANNREAIEYRIPATSWAGADQVERVQKIKSFEDDIGNIIKQFNQEVPQPKKHSLVYQSICHEMDELSKVDAQSHTLVICSDLLHNDDDFSFYRYRDFALAQANPEIAAKMLSEISPMPKVKNLKVFIVNRATTYTAQKKFDVAVRVFECLFKQQGAEVHVGPNIPQYESE